VVRAAHARIAREWRRQGVTSGYRSVRASLPDLATDLVQDGVRLCKRRFRRREQAQIETRRITTTIATRDVMWALDQTHLGRLSDGEAVEAQVLVDAGTSRTLGLSVGAAPAAEDAIALLERTRQVRGTLPLVLCCDNGGPYKAARLEAYAAAHRMAILRNEPRTPQHNPHVERSIGELKAESNLGKGTRLRDAAHAVERALAAQRRLDHCRRRRKHGYKTSVEADRALLPKYNQHDRERIHAGIRCRLEKDVPKHLSLRARRRRERGIVLEALEKEMLIRRRRGDGSSVLASSAGIS
jgi:transposase InsO family protein